MTAAAREPLTPRQAGVYAAIIECAAETGRMPTYRDLMPVIRVGSTNAVVCHVRPLVRKGWLRTDATLSRGIVVPELEAAMKAAARAMLDKGAA